MNDRRPDTGHRLTGWRVAVVWVVAVSGTVAIGLAQVFNPDSWVIVLTVAGAVESFGLVGAILVVRLPGNPVGWLLWASGAALGWGTAGVSYATHSAQTCGGCLPGTVRSRSSPTRTSHRSWGLSASSSRCCSRPADSPRPGGVLSHGSVCGTVLFTVLIGFAPEDSSSIPIENPIGMTGLGALAGVLGVVAIVTLPLAMILALISVFWRFRHAEAVERQQLRWFGFAGLAMVAAVATGMLVPGAWFLMFAGLGMLPLAAGVAILRYRLYDLDRLVSRTIAYAMVSGVLLAVFAGAILIFQAALEPSRAGTDRRRRLDPSGRSPLPAASTPGPDSGRPPLQSGALRRRSDADRVRQPAPW